MSDEFTIQGHCDPAFATLENAFRTNFEKGLEVGASLCVTRAGEPVVDLWGGRGGSICLMDLASRTSLAYVPNHWMAGLLGDPRNELIGETYNRIVG